MSGGGGRNGRNVHEASVRRMNARLAKEWQARQKWTLEAPVRGWRRILRWFRGRLTVLRYWYRSRWQARGVGA